MAPKWFVAKYIPDMRRREPINVGVVVDLGGPRLYRFLGQRHDGSIDGRRLRWAGSSDNYRAWLNYWVASLQSGEQLDRLCVAHHIDSNYYLEPAGERLAGPEVDGETLLDDLYSALVEESPDRDTLSIARLSDDALSSAGIRELVRTDFRYRVETEGVEDDVAFDYRYDNGAINLMQRVPLSYADDRAWEAAHAAAWKFRVVASHPIEAAGAQRQQRCIALVKTRPGDPQLSRQIALLEAHASVVSVDERDSAAARLREIMHI